jgi:hypothetical protein
MTRECHVRFCERLGVQSPGATRQSFGRTQALLDQLLGVEISRGAYGLRPTSSTPRSASG